MPKIGQDSFLEAGIFRTGRWKMSQESHSDGRLTSLNRPLVCKFVPEWHIILIQTWSTDCFLAWLQVFDAHAYIGKRACVYVDVLLLVCCKVLTSPLTLILVWCLFFSHNYVATNCRLPILKFFDCLWCCAKFNIWDKRRLIWKLEFKFVNCFFF